MIQAITVPNTVAIAAPAVPSAGNPKCPCIKQIIGYDIHYIRYDIGSLAIIVLPESSSVPH